MVLALSKGPEHPKKTCILFLNLKKKKKKKDFFCCCPTDNYKLKSGCPDTFVVVRTTGQPLISNTVWNSLLRDGGTRNFISGSTSTGHQTFIVSPGFFMIDNTMGVITRKLFCWLNPLASGESMGKIWHFISESIINILKIAIFVPTCLSGK